MKMQFYTKKLLSLILALLLCFSAIGVFADGDGEGETTDTESTETDEVIVDTGEQRNNDQDQLEIVFNEIVNEETQILNLKVDESKVVSHPTADWFGISDGTLGNVLGTENAYYDKDGRGPNGLKMNQEFIDSFKEFKGELSVVRYGGTFANYTARKNSATKN